MTTESTDINYDALSPLTILSTQFANDKGKPLWTEQPSRGVLIAVGDHIIQDRIHYLVIGVALVAGVMYVNLQRVEGGIQRKGNRTVYSSGVPAPEL